MRHLKFFFLIFCLVWPACAGAVCVEGPRGDVEDALLALYAGNVEVKVKVAKVCGEYAKAFVSRADGSGETDTAYLKKTDINWVVIDEGVNVDPSQLELPEDVW